jgi:hypothetical protein
VDLVPQDVSGETEEKHQEHQSGLGASEIWVNHLPSKKAGRRNTQLRRQIWLSSKLYGYSC